jgi:nucleoside 2-deoxyribosyltransferase
MAEFFISYTQYGADEEIAKAMPAIHSGIRSAGHTPMSMYYLSDAFHESRGHQVIGDFMGYALRKIDEAAGVVCLVTGERIGHGALVEVGAALALGKRTIALVLPDASRYFDTIVDYTVETTYEDLAADAQYATERCHPTPPMTRDLTLSLGAAASLSVARPSSRSLGVGAERTASLLAPLGQM